MKKNVIAGVLAILIVGLLTAAVTMPQDRAVYIDEENNFRMTFPVSWRGRFEVDSAYDGMFIVNTANKSAGFSGTLARINLNGNDGVLVFLLSMETPYDAENERLAAEYRAMLADLENGRYTFRTLGSPLIEYWAGIWDTFLEFRGILREGVLETLYMTFVAVSLAYAIGLPLGVLLKGFDNGGLFANKTAYGVLGFIVNTFRSIPFIILLIFVIPFTRLVVGTAIGATAAIVPLVIASAPFISRMVETALNEVDSGVIDAARSMGATNFQIIWKVMLPESVPTLIRGFSITTIMIMSFSAMAGAVAAGGLGNIAIRYGHMRFRADVMLITIIIIVILVTIIQFLFNLLAAKIDKRPV
jgi:D-methionine transport system permease protein